MTPDETRALIAQGEGQTVEFKASLAETRPGIEALCAMANSQGGVVLFGVDPNGRVIGVTVGKNTIENLVEEVRRATNPTLLPEVYEVDVDGKRVVALRVPEPGPGLLYYAYNRPLQRAGRTNQLMPPELQRQRLMARFQPQVVGGQQPVAGGARGWQARENHREAIYQRNRGLFLIHRWRPSTTPGQVADIQIELHQHREGPLTWGTVREVRYHLGPRFTNKTIRKKNRKENFRLEVSAYGPFLCLARVLFTDGSPPLDLERYIDFS